MDIHDIHYEISYTAARIANELTAEDRRIPARFVHGSVWSPSGARNLGITFDQAILHLSDEIVTTMQEIGHEAMKRALVEQGDLLVGAILGSARKGRNYFDHHHGPVNR